MKLYLEQWWQIPTWTAPIGFALLKFLPDYAPVPDKSEETQSPIFLLFGILNGISFVFTLVCLGFTIFSQAKGNTDLNIFLWTTSGCAVSLCLVELLFCIVGFVAIYRKDYTVLLACSTLVATCGIILYFLIGLGYAFCVVMTHDCICDGRSSKNCQYMPFY